MTLVPAYHMIAFVFLWFLGILVLVVTYSRR